MRHDTLEAYFTLKHPDSKYRIILTTNMFVKILPLNAMMIGCNNINLPDYIINSKSLISFDNLQNNLCFWYCIAYHFVKRYDRCKTIMERLYYEFVKNELISDYSGIKLSDIDKYEEFKKN